jgi:hypothetical protein
MHDTKEACFFGVVLFSTRREPGYDPSASERGLTVQSLEGESGADWPDFRIGAGDRRVSGASLVGRTGPALL